MIQSPLGHSRTVVRPTHALIAPDSHVVTPLPGWEKTRGTVLISPAMGTRFVQYLAHLEEGSASAGAPAGCQRFLYVLDGQIHVDDRKLSAGGYAYFPADQAHRISSGGRANVLVFEKWFEPLEGSIPRAIVGNESEVAATAFMGDADTRLKTLLPDELGFDMAINILAYKPGGMLPQVECHVMEHGLLMLEGMGVYRLGDEWHPVQAGDVIWMGPHCPQWFIAGGKTVSRYIYYKNVNRDAMGAR